MRKWAGNAELWSAMTCHRFPRLGDLSPKQRRVQRRDERRVAPDIGRRQVARRERREPVALQRFCKSVTTRNGDRAMLRTMKTKSAGDDSEPMATSGCRAAKLWSVWPETGDFCGAMSGRQCRLRPETRTFVQSALKRAVTAVSSALVNGGRHTASIGLSPIGASSSFRPPAPAGGRARAGAAATPARSRAGCSSSPRSRRSAGSLPAPRPDTGSSRDVPGC